jgi:hypothetical protein
MDLSNIDSVILTMYEVISGEAGKARDWKLLRSLYHPGARLMPALSPPDGSPQLRVLTVDDFIHRVESIFEKESFWERETHREIETFGRIAHVLSYYESLRDPNGAPFTTGKKTMQLYFDDVRWWIVSAMWNTERSE